MAVVNISDEQQQHFPLTSQEKIHYIVHGGDFFLFME